MSTRPVHLAAELGAVWRSRAACAGHRHSIFFPAGDTGEGPAKRALEICTTCSVVEECLEYAFETNQTAGIWGGTTEVERRALRRRWLAARHRAS